MSAAGVPLRPPPQHRTSPIPPPCEQVRTDKRHPTAREASCNAVQLGAAHVGANLFAHGVPQAGMSAAGVPLRPPPQHRTSPIPPPCEQVRTYKRQRAAREASCNAVRHRAVHVGANLFAHGVPQAGMSAAGVPLRPPPQHRTSPIRPPCEQVRTYKRHPAAREASCNAVRPGATTDSCGKSGSRSQCWIPDFAGMTETDSEFKGLLNSNDAQPSFRGREAEPGIQKTPESA